MTDAMTLNYDIAEARARALWTRHDGPWALDAAGQPVLRHYGPDDPRNGHFTDVHSPLAVSFNRSGAIIRALEEQVGIGRSTSRQFAVLWQRLGPDYASVASAAGKATSAAKTAAARANGRKGGRPRKAHAASM